MKATKYRSLAAEAAFTHTLEDKVRRIQSGDDNLRNNVIGDYQPFIKKVVSKVCNRFIDQTMDEYSIGMFAFNEALDQYRRGQGSKFLTFADMVIRRRIIDFIRKEARQAKMMYFDQAETELEDSQEESYYHQQAALDHYDKQQQIEERLEQIEAYKLILKNYGITFKVLSKSCPKHMDARENAKQIARILVEKKDLGRYLIEKRQLPIKDLLQFVTCSRKTIERNRKYIIAVALIYLNHFTALKPYIEPEAEMCNA